MQEKSFKKAMAYVALASILIYGLNSCKKETSGLSNSSIAQSKRLIADLNAAQSVSAASLSELKEKDDQDDGDKAAIPFNLNVILTGEEDQLGYIRFRQQPGTHIITLDTWVFNLEPNHVYLLQRAVDPLDYNCTSTSWLTLGKGLMPQSILTNSWGFGMAQLFRNVTAIPSGSTFDIHFQIIDALTKAVVLRSGCYQYMVR
ncbi:MAG: hypothetical protein NVS1B13_17070 [Flavisolibacter sp.]